MAAVLPVLFSPVRRIREMPAPVEEVPSADEIAPEGIVEP